MTTKARARTTKPASHACDDRARDNLKLVQLGPVLCYALPFRARGYVKGPTPIHYCPWCGARLENLLAAKGTRRARWMP